MIIVPQQRLKYVHSLCKSEYKLTNDISTLRRCFDIKGEMRKSRLFALAQFGNFCSTRES